MKVLCAILAMMLLATSAYAANRHPPKNGVYFAAPKNGAVVGTEFRVLMGVRGMQVTPAGAISPKTGHHHLLVDTKPVAKGKVIPADDQHLHFGKGQSETTLTLPPGKHTLMLQFADGVHRSYGPGMRAVIRVTVK